MRGRPTLGLEKKEKLTLTISKQTKEMLDIIRNENSISISEFVENCITKEYKKIQKSKENNVKTK